MMLRNPLFAILTLLLLISHGCGGGVNRKDVSGEANFDGKPIVYGTVQFIPKGSDAGQSPSGTAIIENGSFDTSKGGQGLLPGLHQIKVTAYPSKPIVSEDETAETEEVAPLFVDYSYEATITPPTYTINIPADAAGHNALGGAIQRPRANDP